MKRLTTYVLSGILVISAAAAVFADPEGCNKCGMKRGGMMGGMQGDGMGPMHHDFMERVEQLDLAQDQKAAIKDIQVNTQKDMIRKRSDLQVAMVELQELLAKDAVDMKSVEAKLKQIEGLRTAVHLTMIKEQEAIKAKLTADQKSRMRSEEKQGCPMERRHGGGQEGHGPMHH